MLAALAAQARIGAIAEQVVLAGDSVGICPSIGRGCNIADLAHVPWIYGAVFKAKSVDQAAVTSVVARFCVFIAELIQRAGVARWVIACICVLVAGFSSVAENAVIAGVAGRGSAKIKIFVADFKTVAKQSVVFAGNNPGLAIIDCVACLCPSAEFAVVADGIVGSIRACSIRTRIVGTRNPVITVGILEAVCTLATVFIAQHPRAGVGSGLAIVEYIACLRAIAKYCVIAVGIVGYV
jgi:hypothetical protein